MALNHSNSKSPAAISTHAPAIENGEGWGNQCHDAQTEVKQIADNSVTNL